MESIVDWTFEGNKVRYIPGIYDVSFVYIITNNIDGRQYVGKKGFWKTQYYQVKCKKKRRKVESDWHTYWGSNKELLEDIAKLGKENFSREILHFCKSKAWATYRESEEQFVRKVLEFPDKYYNSWIMCRVRRSNLK